MAQRLPSSRSIRRALAIATPAVVRGYTTTTRPRSYNVVVTAFGPFKNYTCNPAAKVRDRLPDCIKRDLAPSVNIIRWPSFRNVLADMDMIPEMWSGEKQVYDPDARPGERIRIDAMVHLGLHERHCWSVETRARRDGYHWVGEDGKFLPVHNGGKSGRWSGLPWVLTPTYDVEMLVKIAHAIFPDMPIEASDDAGLLYCEFILYQSLATLYQRGETARALFLHVPPHCAAERDIDEGAELLQALLCMMVDSLEM